MRAVVVEHFGSVDDARLTELTAPVPGAAEVLVEVRAAPVNYVDLLTMSGKYQFVPPLPYTPGKGPAGVVKAVGRDVRGVAIGDRVLAMAERGGYAELAVAEAHQVYRLPDWMSFAEAAAMSVSFDTAWVALRDRARLERGESVLVLGATGAVGNAAVQLAKAMGAGIVLAGVSSAERFDLAKAAGADAMVDLSRPAPVDSIRKQVFEATGGAGVDVVIDPLGAEAFDGAIRAVRWRGRLVVVGFAAGRIPALAVNYVLLKNIDVSGLQISDYRKRWPELLAECYREIFHYCEEKSVRAPAHTVLPLAEWKSALRTVEDRKAGSRLVLVPN